MTTLNQLKTMKDEDIQNWLRKVGKDHVQTLVVALVGADAEVKDCVYRNMSGAAITYLKRDLEVIRSVGLQESIIRGAAQELESLI